MFQPMLRRTQAGVSLAILLAVIAGLRGSPAVAQSLVRQIFARARVFPEIGPGVSVLKRDAAGEYYILAAPANSIAVYAAGGKRMGQIPNANSREAKITYAQDFDLDASGRVFVADRGANAVKIFGRDGTLDASVRIVAPMSVAALPGEEFAVASLRSDRLISIYNSAGTLIRTFGDLRETTSAGDQAAPLDPGRLYGDAAGHLYFAFTDLPDPTIRKYDRYGYAAYEASLPAAEFVPPAQARRWDTVTIQAGGGTAPPKPAIRALGIDAARQEVWAAIGDELVHFDKDGNRRAAYHATTKEGAPIEPVSILVESDRILLADDPLGIFDFALPDQLHTNTSEK